MPRVSVAEMYDDKDVIIQILKLKDGLNSALGGIIADIDIVNDELVIDWADGESISLPLPSPTGISSIAGSVSGGNLTMTIYMTDGSSHAFTCPLNGMASEAYVDAGLSGKVDVGSVYTTGEIDTMLAGYATTAYADSIKTLKTDLTAANLGSELYDAPVGSMLTFFNLAGTGFNGYWGCLHKATAAGDYVGSCVTGGKFCYRIKVNDANGDASIELCDPYGTVSTASATLTSINNGALFKPNIRTS